MGWAFRMLVGCNKEVHMLDADEITIILIHMQDAQLQLEEAAQVQKMEQIIQKLTVMLAQKEEEG